MKLIASLLSCSMLAFFLVATAPLQGQSCSTPISVGSLPYSHNGQSTCSYNNDITANACGSSYHVRSRDAVYTYTPSTNVTVDITLSSMTDNRGTLLVTTSCNSSNSADCVDYYSNGSTTADITLSNLSLSAGTTYYIVVDRRNSGSCLSNYDLDITAVASAPANDQCSGAFLIGCDTSFTASTLSATTTGEPSYCGTSVSAPGVWYRIEGNGDIFNLSTCNLGTLYDTKINVYSGSCGTLSCIDGNDDGDLLCLLSSKVSFLSQIGTTYYVYVQGYGGATGIFDLSVSCYPYGIQPTDTCNLSDVDGDGMYSTWDTLAPPSSVDSTITYNICHHLFVSNPYDAQWLQQVQVKVSGCLENINNASPNGSNNGFYAGGDWTAAISDNTINWDFAYGTNPCPSGQVEVEIDITTDDWGYENYWELLPSGNSCGSATIFAGGNSLQVGCGGGGNRVASSGNGYVDNSTINEGPWCLTEGADYDINFVDDWGDGIFGSDDFVVRVNGSEIGSYEADGANDVITFTAEGLAYGDGVSSLYTCQEYTFCYEATVNGSCPDGSEIADTITLTDDGIASGGGSVSPNSYVLTSEPGAGDEGTYITYTSGPLPVEMLYFQAEKLNESNSLLSWATSLEIDNDHFDIERSADGITFEKIAEVPGQGNSTDVNQYHYLDSKPLSGANYYRLKQVDFNGEFEYTQIEVLFYNGDEQELTVALYPNPAHNQLIVQTQGSINGEQLSYQLYNVVGQAMEYGSLNPNNKTTLNISQLPAGSYTFQLHTGDGNTKSIRFLKVE